MYKKIFEGKRAALFDLSGTVVKEIEEYGKQSFESVLESLALSYIDPRKFFIEGAGIKNIWEALKETYKELGEYKTEELEGKTKETLLKLLKEGDLNVTDGFWDILYELKVEKNFKTALVTNTARDISKEVMNKLDLNDMFDLVLCGDDVEKLKPDPQIYKRALKELKVSAKETIAFEDSYPGVQSAGRADIDTIVIWDGKRKKQSFKGKVADFSVDFTPYPGKMDDEYSDYLAQTIIESKEEDTKISQSL